jgi:drug/metabolite transporter (DMT)-like permease
LLRNASTPLVSTYAYVNPLVAVFLGWALLGEHINGQTLSAAAVIVVAVAMILGRSPAPRRRAAPARLTSDRTRTTA